jgi:hypothetical protein
MFKLLHVLILNINILNDFFKFARIILLKRIESESRRHAPPITVNL